MASDFQFNGKRYSVLEEEKVFSYTPENESSPHTFTLRHLIIWNHASNRRTAGLVYAGPIALSTEEATRAILSRWGAQENTFKHLQKTKENICSILSRPPFGTCANRWSIGYARAMTMKTTSLICSMPSHTAMAGYGVLPTKSGSDWSRFNKLSDVLPRSISVVS